MRRLPIPMAAIALLWTHLAALLLEPESSDSFLRWGFFAECLEAVEYAEAYVMEAMAEEMLRGDPELAREFETRLLEDPEFAADPWAIRYWFYEKTPYYDQKAFLYPVGCLDDRDGGHVEDRADGRGRRDDVRGEGGAEQHRADRDGAVHRAQQRIRDVSGVERRHDQQVGATF